MLLNNGLKMAIVAKQHIDRAENAVISPVTAQILEDFAACWKCVSYSSLQRQQFRWSVFYPLYKRVVPGCCNVFYGLWNKPWLNTFRTITFIQFWSATILEELSVPGLPAVTRWWWYGKWLCMQKRRKVPERHFLEWTSSWCSKH